MERRITTDKGVGCVAGGGYMLGGPYGLSGPPARPPDAPLLVSRPF